MKNPLHVFHKPVGSESTIEGLAAASAAVPSGIEVASEVGEQTEMLTRLRRRNRPSPSGGAGSVVSAAKNERA